MQLILMKIGGRIIYSGPLGERSSKVIEYFEVSCFTILSDGMLPVIMDKLQLSNLDCTFLTFLSRIFLECLRLRTDTIQQHGC